MEGFEAHRNSALVLLYKQNFPSLQKVKTISGKAGKSVFFENLLEHFLKDLWCLRNFIPQDTESQDGQKLEGVLGKNSTSIYYSTSKFVI